MHEDRTQQVQIIFICSIIHRTSFIQNLSTLTIREFQFVVRHKAAGIDSELKFIVQIIHVDIKLIVRDRLYSKPIDSGIENQDKASTIDTELNEYKSYLLS